VPAPTAAPPGAPGVPTAAGGPPAAPTPPGPPPFANVIKDARRIDGPLTVWRKDDKAWIELSPGQLGKPWLLSPKIKSGIGEAWVLGGLMALPVNGVGGATLVAFERVHNQIRLVARNTLAVTTPGTPEARAAADSYAHSLLGVAPVVSQPHPDRKSVLIEANPLFLGDVIGLGMMLQRGLRQGYGLDRGNSLITDVRGSEQALVIETQNHFYTGSVGVPAPTLPTGGPMPSVPRFVPDPRSLLVSLSYSLSPLPETPMRPRPADPRVGLFSTTVLDFTGEQGASPRARHVNRWRLEKKDPAAELSDPVTPITFWIDRNVPLAYRETVRAAILEWNKAFEKIGFRQAIRVEQQPDDARFDTLDVGYNGVRWMLNASPSFGAIGPSHVDPRSGEILDADIGFEGLTTRNVRALRSEVMAPGTTAAGAGDDPTAPFSRAFGQPFALPGLPLPAGHAHDALGRCLHGELAAEQLGYALDVLQARDELPPDSPVAQQFVLDYIKEALMHEVGHALGLRHNFRASRAYNEAQLADPEFTRAYGTTGSVMEYNAVNLPSPGQRGGMPFHTTLGPYDYWAIEYAYKPLPPGAKPAEERAELQRIAARSHEPLLAFGTDEDSQLGIDPETLQMDLGDDPLAFAAKRLEIARDLFKRQETRALSPERDYAVLRRSIGYALADATRALGVLARQVGGVRTLRDFPGSGRDPLVPVPAEVQRQALALLAGSTLSPQGLSLSPALQRRLAPDFLDRAEAGGFGTDFGAGQRLLELQRAVLGFLMSDGLAQRILDNLDKLDEPARGLQLSDIYNRLHQDLWADLPRAARSGIAPARRELQREQVNRLAASVLRPTPGGRVALRSQQRSQAQLLLTQLQAALRQGAALDADSRQHLADSADTLRLALNAPLQRLGL
jgi:hypothetical protein